MINNNSLTLEHSEEYLEHLAQFIHIPYTELRPYKNEFITRKYNKGQVVYYSSDDMTHMYFLLEGHVLREHFNKNGDVYRILNKDSRLFPLHSLFQEHTTNEMCTTITDCVIISVPIDFMEYLCLNHANVFKRIYQLLCKNEQQQMEYHMALNAKSAKESIIKILIYLCHTIGYDNDEFYEIKSFLTIQMISNLASVSRETTGHIIHELKEDNILMHHSKNWIISKAILKAI
ncbi:Crp/Fnr family transcriptional regulator [Staphylococcus auricularis]|uniref:Crp/Fnr family transcriptional regulator n=1 Tax=Staphylococcus auricularis TaxID=29379 RepID=UPI003EBD3401